LQHCIQVRFSRDDLARGFGSFSQDVGQFDRRFSGDIVMKSRDYGAVARKALALTLPLKLRDPLR